MRLFPIIAAIVVSVAIYALVFERERFLAMVAGPETAETVIEATTEDDPEAAPPPAEAVRVVAVKSKAREIDRAVIVRGQTEADRQVEIRAETTGQVISDPLRKGAFVEEGQMLCKLDPGTRGSTLAEAQARLAEARARVPEARAKVPEAEARVDEAASRLTEAQSRLSEAQINFNAAQKLSEEGFASTTRVASTEAAVRGAEAGVVSAQAGLKSAEAGLETVAAGIETARAAVESAQAAVAAAEREIERLTMSAPFAGLLESDSAELGCAAASRRSLRHGDPARPDDARGVCAGNGVSRVSLGAAGRGWLRART
jgi:multidrug efflux system membrane fusion protein